MLLQPFFHLPLPSLLASAVGVYWIIWIIYSRTLHPLRNIPGPFLASVSRVWVIREVYRGRMEHTQRQLHKKYGPLIRIAPNEIAVADPAAIKQIYRTKGPLAKSDFYSIWGNSSISKHADNFSNTNEKTHSERRRIVNHIYSLSNVLQSETYIDYCSNLFMDRLEKAAKIGKPIDLGVWLQWYAFDVIGELYFGSMFGFLHKLMDHESYIHSLDSLMPTLCIAAIAPSYMRPIILGSSLMVPSVRAALKAIDHIAAAAKSCVSKRVESLEYSHGEHGRQDILQQLMDVRNNKGDKIGFDLAEVELESYVALFAGSDTTAIAFRAVFYYLLKNPKVYESLLHELDSAAIDGRLSLPVKYSEAIKLPLLCACIKEAMRLHPSVALTMPRLSPPGGMTLCNTFIPEGYRVGINPAVLHRDNEIFGEDSDIYRPERWIEDDTANMDKHLLIFGAGTRTCIGKNISLSELHKLIPAVLRAYKLELATEKPWTTMNLWFNKQSGLHVVLKPRV